MTGTSGVHARHRWVAGAALLLPILTHQLRAQTPADTLVSAGKEYQIRGGTGRWLYGSRYRALWATPVAAPGLLADVGDSAEAYWLWTPTGALWKYRPLDRNLLAAAPPALRRNLLPSVIQDVNAVRHPGAAPVVQALAEAVGIRVPATRLVRLTHLHMAAGEAGRLGYLVETDTAGRETVEVLDSLRASGGRDFDGRAYLRDRLFDAYVGQWDIEPEQWRWTRDTATGRWTPEPRTRDYAFAKFDGLLARLAGFYYSGLVNFGTSYQGQLGVTPYQRQLDRQLLALVDRAAWDSVAAAMQAALSDSIIDAAVATLPPEYRDSSATPLATALRARRDRLSDAARGLYRLVNREAAFFGTPGADTVTITRSRDGSVTLLFPGGRSRSYGPGETSAVALYLLGGADHIKLVGPGNAGPLLDIAWRTGLTLEGDPGSGQRARLYGGGPRSGSLRLEIVPDTLPIPEVQNLDLSAPPPVPLHGVSVSPVPWFEANSDVGLLLGGGVNLTDYRVGFTPFYRKLQIRAAYLTGVQSEAIELHGEFHRWHSRTAFTLDVGVPSVSLLRFFGYGNTTPFTEPASYYLVRRREIYIAPLWHYELGARTRLALGPVFKQVQTDTSRNDFISQSHPYGVPEFAQLGAVASASFDTRDTPVFTRSGWNLTAGGSFYPLTFGGSAPFGSIQASAATYLTPGARGPVTVALRASGQLTFGDVPVHEAAYLGGATSLRGYWAGRYAGQSSAFGNGEVRARLATVPFVAPWRFGVVGLGDVGRVFNETDNADVWHASAGGGVWFALPDRSTGFVVTFAWSDQGTAFFFGSGFMF
jgi:hypothetical protein